MEKLETKIAQPTATPELIVGPIQSMASETVEGGNFSALANLAAANTRFVAACADRYAVETWFRELVDAHLFASGDGLYSSGMRRSPQT